MKVRFASPKVGDTIRFRDKWGQQITGIVVDEHRWAHCPGCDTIVVYAPHGGNWDHSPVVYQIAPWSAEVIAQAVLDPTAVDAANRHYRQYLTRYPVWAERFRQDPDYHFWPA